MGNTVTLTNATDEFVDQIDKEADALGLTRGEYARQRLNAGRLLFNAGKLDVDLLDELMETDGSERPDADIETLDGDVSQQILSALPRDEDRAATISELREEVFGTKTEQEELIETILKQLNTQGKIKPAFGEGYVKND
jgi:hypothetical protein